MKLTRVGAPPYKKPWPKGDNYDPELLKSGDKRNVIDEYRYQTVDAIKQAIQDKSYGLEVAIENYKRDFNIGTIVRNANAFAARKVHIIGSRQWNKRGAMMTDKYLEIVYHKDAAEFIKNIQKPVIAVDNQKGAVNMHEADLPRESVYVFGSESDGVSQEIIEASDYMVAIEQFGSTRSVNVGVASGIVMYEWTRRNIFHFL